MVTLHVVLVDAVVLEVDEDAVDEADPEGAMSEVGQRERTERELTMSGGIERFPPDLEGLHGSFGHREKQHTQTDQGTADKDKPLDGFGPDDRFHASQHGVEDNGG